MADLRRGGRNYSYGATNLGEYDDWHYAFNVGGQRYFVVRTKGSGGFIGDDKYAIVSADDTNKVLGYSASATNNNALDWAEEYIQQRGAFNPELEGMTDETMETAPDVKYSDLARFLDPNTGNVSDKGGLIQYLYTLPQFKGKPIAQLEEAISDMPKLHMSQGDVRAAQQGAYTDIYGIQQDIGQERSKAQSEMAVSGVSSPSSTSFGGTGESFAEGLYSQAGAGMSSMQDTYGLTDEKEQEFSNWLSNFS